MKFNRLSKKLENSNISKEYIIKMNSTKYWSIPENIFLKKTRIFSIIIFFQLSINLKSWSILAKRMIFADWHIVAVSANLRKRKDYWMIWVTANTYNTCLWETLAAQRMFLQLHILLEMPRTLLRALFYQIKII